MTGKIDVTFEGDSYLLRSNMPHQVRDADLRVVGRAIGNHTYELEPGLYVVDAITTNGEQSSKAIEVGDDTTVPVNFSYHFEASPDQSGPLRSVYPTDAEIDGVGLTTSPGDDPIPWLDHLSSREDSSEVHLIQTAACGVVDESVGRFVFASDGDIGETPRAWFAVGHDVVEVSLPLHVQSPYPLNAASVSVHLNSSGSTRLVTEFAPERQVASAMDRMLGSDSILQGAEVFSAASELLLDKYSDPPAAALGGLTLHRLGRLGEHTQWVRNLANGFPWLPDGSVLLAAIMRGDRDEAVRREGRALLVKASYQRPMFTDALSLMLELLRRWPDGDDDECRERVRNLSIVSAGADLDATCLTVTISRDLVS